MQTAASTLVFLPSALPISSLLLLFYFLQWMLPVRSSHWPASSMLLARALRQRSFISFSCESHLAFCYMTFLDLQNQESWETISIHDCKCSLRGWEVHSWGIPLVSAGEKMDLLFSLLCSHCKKSAGSPLAAQGVRDKVKEHLRWAFNETMGLLPLKGTWKSSLSMRLCRLASSLS